MARSFRRAREYRDRLVRLLAHGPKTPSELSFRAWLGVVRRVVVEFFEDGLNDRAASLTYYSIMSIFPGLLVLMASMSLLGNGVTDDIVRTVRELAPGPARDIIVQGIADLRSRPATSAIVGSVALALSFWSATGYIGGFMRAANAIYDVPEARPLWKTIPIQLVVTAITGVGFTISALAVVFTGRVADWAGRAVGVEKQVVLVFNIVKWPVLVVLVLLLIALLYWISPNARQGGFRWITPGSVLAVAGIAAVTAGFAAYIAKFDSYNRTFGSIGGVIIFLVWLWLTNIAILVGAELDAEMGRARAMAAGLPKDAEPYLPLRDLPKLPDVPLAGHHPELDDADPEERTAAAMEPMP
jgi:membrane protein